MTAADAQAVLTTIHGHLDGKAGDIKDIHIMAEGETIVEVDFAAFRSAFAGMGATRHGKRWRITVGNQVPITYTAVDHVSSGTDVVPAADPT